MKKRKVNLIILAFAFALVSVACGDQASDKYGKDKAIENVIDAVDDATDEEANSDEDQGKEYTSAYVCTMHCEGSGSDTEGSCPKCGMDYVMNEDHMTDGHEHKGHGHEGHEH
ncbi:MAG: hypothetical protein HKN39_02400 [Flavobacteriales bacterium]|nr:hypothetical protein [Flavobacteriales bacterium]